MLTAWKISDAKLPDWWKGTALHLLVSLLKLRPAPTKRQGRGVGEGYLLAQMHKATLVVGKQDRLGRNNHFITGLMEKKIRFMSAIR